MSFTTQEYNLEIRSLAATVYAVGTTTTHHMTVGGAGTALDPTGWTVVNPYDVAWAGDISRVPESDAARAITDGHMDMVDIMLTGELYGANPSALQAAIATLNSSLHAHRQNPSKYLLMSLWDGAALDKFRRYFDVAGSVTPMARKTRLSATEYAQIMLRTLDAGVYSDVLGGGDLNVIAGYGLSAISPAGNMETRRVCYKIKKTGASNPTNVTITTGDGALTITGSLTGINDYWLVDVYAGTVRFYDASPAGDTDAIALVSGKFPSITNGTDVLVVTDTAGATFVATTYWLPRHQ